MATGSEASRTLSRAVRRGLRVFGLGAVSLLTAALLLPILGVAQDEPRPASTPHYVHSTPIPPGAKVPMPSIAPPHAHMLAIHIDGYQFMMWPGPCAHRVSAAIQAHQDLLTGDEPCDKLIRQARGIQRQKEAEDPDYAKPAVTPTPTPAESEEDAPR